MRNSTLVLAVVCAAGTASAAEPGLDLDLAALRAEGPAALERLLARWDRLPDGAERDALAAAIDHVAGQRYATTARLYWYTDLDDARAAARASRRPILALRLLGRLDEDLSCANSRYFRVALYANRALSAFLREHFVLYWTSERAAPRVIVDYGDGRRIERTITGNSAHYVLDEDGRPIDVLPGLYAPAVFRAELADSLALSAAVAGKGEDQRRREIRRHHAARLAQRDGAWRAIGKLALDGDDAIAAQRLTVGKALVEMPVMRLADLGPKVGDIPDDPAVWAQAGARLAARGRVLDAQSRALVLRLSPRTDLARFERDILADTGKNELVVRRMIRDRFIEGGGVEDFASLNAFVYSAVFRTPADDPWLGLRTDRFTGLPGDGVSEPPGS